MITLLLLLMFLLPLAAGAVRPFSREWVRRSLMALVDSLEFFGCLALSAYLTRRIFFDASESVFHRIYEAIPSSITNLLTARDALVYMVAVPVLMLILLLLARFATRPLYRAAAGPVTDGAYRLLNTMGGFMRRLAGALVKLPAACCLALLAALILYFFSYYSNSLVLSRWMSESAAYQEIYQRALYPALNSNLAKQIPVIIRDSFARTLQEVLPGVGGKNPLITEYFNGVTLEEAVKSTPDIDKTAVDVAGSAKSDREKARLLYRWISRHVHYDYDKAEKLGESPRGISSGSRVAFETRKGVCFDYSSLYVSMCRAVGLKVRLVTGLGYSGIAWGDHAWNQVYDASGESWMNVDTTFGTTADYFDKPDFQVDHRDAEIQGEWPKT